MRLRLGIRSPSCDEGRGSTEQIVDVVLPARFSGEVGGSPESSGLEETSGVGPLQRHREPSEPRT